MVESGSRADIEVLQKASIAEEKVQSNHEFSKQVSIPEFSSFLDMFRLEEFVAGTYEQNFEIADLLEQSMSMTQQFQR